MVEAELWLGVGLPRCAYQTDIALCLLKYLLVKQFNNSYILNSLVVYAQTSHLVLPRLVLRREFQFSLTSDYG